MTNPHNPTPAEHIATLASWLACSPQNWDGATTTPALPMGQALAWALPILRAALATPEDREWIATVLEATAGEQVSPPPIGMFSGGQRSEAMRKAAALLKILPPACDAKSPERSVPTLEEMLREPGPDTTAEIRQILGAAPAEHLPSTLRLIRAILQAQDGERMTDAAKRLFHKRQAMPDPAPTGRCPCCERNLATLTGEAPTAVNAWICSGCYDAGMMRVPTGEEQERIEAAAEALRDKMTLPAPVPHDRIRQTIEDWHEAAGVEAERAGVTPGHRERAADEAMVLFRVLGLFPPPERVEAKGT